jgi:hypothetical protein
MMLIAALTVWLVLLLLFVALCRMAAYKDGRDSAPGKSSSEPFAVARTVAAGLVVWEDQPAVALRELSDLRIRVPAAR